MNQSSVGSPRYTVTHESSVDTVKIRAHSARAGRTRVQFLSLPKNRTNRYDLFGINKSY